MAITRPWTRHVQSCRYILGVKIGHGDVPDGDKEDKASQGDDESTLNVKD
jgi:hypothetical protein